MTRKTKGGDFHASHRGSLHKEQQHGKANNPPKPKHHHFFKPKDVVPETGLDARVAELALIVTAIQAAQGPR